MHRESFSSVKRKPFHKCGNNILHLFLSGKLNIHRVGGGVCVSCCCPVQGHLSQLIANELCHWKQPSHAKVMLPGGETPCSSSVSLCTDPCCVSRLSEANSQRFWRGWASWGPCESNPCSYKSAWASPHLTLQSCIWNSLHLLFWLTVTLSDEIHKQKAQAGSVWTCNMGLLKQIPSFREKWLSKKKPLSWAVMISHPEGLMVRPAPMSFKVRFLLSISSPKMQHCQACVV